jgi:hypothetical protein
VRRGVTPVVLFVFLGGACGGGNSGPGGVGEDEIVLGTRIHPMPMQSRIIHEPPSEPMFEYFGGPVVARAKVVEVLWGPGVVLAADLGRFYAAITDSSYFDVLAEYGTETQPISRGSFVGLVTHPAPPQGRTVDDTAIQTELARLIHRADVPVNDDDTIYIVHFPPGVTVTQGGAASCTNFCAYHGSFRRNGKIVPYAVIPDLDGGCAQGCGEGDKLSNTTWVASHVLAQVVTDPAIGFGGKEPAPPMAWFDPQVGEISDACNGTARVGGFVVKTQWSPVQGRCRSGAGDEAPFGLTVSPTSQTVRAGTSATLLVTTMATAPRPPMVTLAVSGLPSGVTGSLEPVEVMAGQTSTLTLQADEDAAATVTDVTVTGVAGRDTKRAAATLTVESSRPSNDFTVGVNPTTRAVRRGQSVTFDVSTAVAAGVSEPIMLLASGLPEGVAASFAPATVDAGDASELTVSAGAAAALGSALVTITAATPSRTRTATISLDVEDLPPLNDYMLAITPPMRAVAAGGTTTFTVSSTVTSGSAQTVQLAAVGLPAGVTASFEPPSITGASSAVLTLTASAAAPASTGPFSVMGTAPSGTRTTAAALTVMPAPPVNDFSLAVAPGSRSVAAGESTTFTVTTAVTTGSPVQVAFAISGLPSGVSAEFAPSSVVAGEVATLTITAAAGAAIGASALTVTGASVSGNKTADASLTVTPPPPSDFSLAVTPAAQTVAAGASTSFSVTTQLVSGRAETVALSVTSLPVGVSGSFAPASVTAGGSATLTLTAAADAPARAADTITIRGVAPSATHTKDAELTVTAQPPPDDFSLAVTPDSREVTPGTSATFTVSTQVTSGNPQPVSLAVSGLPSGASGAFDPAVVQAGQSSTLTIGVTAGAAQGETTFTVTGAGGTTTRLDTATLAIRPPPVGNLFENPGFETGTLSGWTVDDGSGAVQATTATAHGGTHSARIGSSVLYVGWSGLYQGIDVPAGRTTTLSFWAYARCPEIFGTQKGYLLRPDGTILRTLFNDCDDSGQWERLSYDLTPYAGQEVLLYVEVNDGYFFATWLYLDDVATTTE